MKSHPQEAVPTLLPRPCPRPHFQAWGGPLSRRLGERLMLLLILGLGWGAVS